MYSVKERILKVLMASDRVLSQIDRIRDGEEFVAKREDEDIRTVTLTEAARRLGVSRPTVYRLAKAGRITCVPLNGVNRILLRSVLEYTLCGNRGL